MGIDQGLQGSLARAEISLGIKGHSLYLVQRAAVAEQNTELVSALA